MNEIVFLVTADQERNGARTATNYSGIFVRLDDSAGRRRLDTVETEVLDFMRKTRSKPDEMGGATGYVPPFAADEQQMPAYHG